MGLRRWRDGKRGCCDTCVRDSWYLPDHARAQGLDWARGNGVTDRPGERSSGRADCVIHRVTNVRWNALVVAINAAGSNDPDGTIASYTWNFGDGATATGGAPLHTYIAQGAYSATLTVADNDGMTDASTLVIVVIDGGQGGCR